jgi:hypothetical protein
MRAGVGGLWVLMGALYRMGAASRGSGGGEMTVAGGAPSVLWLLEGEAME